MKIRIVNEDDASKWEALREALWPASSGEHATEIAAYFRGVRANPAAVFIATDDVGNAIGFCELSIRSYAEGCSTDRVAYLEGWYVSPKCRLMGIGRALVEASEDWARKSGCREFASDTELKNEKSASAHLALGFAEVDRIVCFRKNI